MRWKFDWLEFCKEGCKNGKKNPTFEHSSRRWVDMALRSKGAVHNEEWLLVIALELKFSEPPPSLASGAHGWHNVWTLDLSEKINFFVQRAAENLLITAENL